MDISNRRQLGVNKLSKAIKKDYTTATSSASSSSSSAAAMAISTNNSGGGSSSGHSSTRFPEPPAKRASQQPSVYNISKRDFRAFVQQLTGAAGTSCVLALRSPMHPDNRPAASNRLQQVRPPPLAPIARTAAAVVENPSHPLPRFSAESPVSAYLRYIESSLLHSDGSRGALHPASSSRASPAVPPATSPLGFPSPSALLNLPSPDPLMLSPSPRWRDV